MAGRKATVSAGLVLCWLFVALATGPARAEEKGSRAKVIVHGDVAIPMNPPVFSDGFSLGLGGGAGMAWPLSRHFGLVADVEYIIFGVDDSGFREATGVPPTVSLEGDQIATLYASLGLKYSLIVAGTLRPYVMAGAGFFRYNPDGFAANGTTLPGFDNENTAGAHVALGVEAVLAPYLELFLDAVYVVGFTENDPTGYLSIRPGVAFDLKPVQ